MKGWVFLLPTITKEDADAYFPEHKVCQVPSGQGEQGGHTGPGRLDAAPRCCCAHAQGTMRLGGSGSGPSVCGLTLAAFSLRALLLLLLLLQSTCASRLWRLQPKCPLEACA